ncbi:conserved exported hypothetical protein [Microcystis aeruginosa PCC 9432]|uniref:Uncharacterized protein n=1 Tax=Microcystis aeruginosa PCC 9432 TaxID=1160280 RepID=A0A830ZXK8_MICAE|nr:conserved exported hypothetical protein [Microcystis aeruginosa PCC 9432]
MARAWLFCCLARRAMAAAARRRVCRSKSAVFPNPTRINLRIGPPPPRRVAALLPNFPSNSVSEMRSSRIPPSLSFNSANSPAISMAPSGKPRAKVSPVQVRSEVSVDRISILYLDNSLQNAYINHYTVSSISGCLILCVISLTYIVVIDLCVLCVWSGSFHSLAHKTVS